MRWCRIRLVLLGLLLCVVHVVSGICGQNFTDPASSAFLADVVIEGKVRSTSDPDDLGTYNITVAVKKNILKGGELINRGRPPKTITVDRFKAGGKDKQLCLGQVQKGRTYLFFLKDIQDRKGLYFNITAMPVKKSKKVISEVKSVLCDGCAKPPSIQLTVDPKKQYTTGRNISFKCSVQNPHPSPVFSWYKDDVLITKSQSIYQIKNNKRNSTLLIKSAAINDTGVYECVATSIIGQARKDKKIIVIYPHQAVPCLIQTYCLNGGSCLHISALSITFCKCPEPWAGRRCEQLDGIRVSGDYNRQASLVLERTLIIIGIVIAVLVFIIICIVSYALAKRARRQFEQRRKRRQARQSADSRPIAISVESRHTPQLSTNKHESLSRSQMLTADTTAKQPGQIVLQDSSSPPASQPPGGHYREFPQRLLHSETKANPNGNEPRGRLAASSVYDNFRSAELSHLPESGDLPRGKETTHVGRAPTETAEVKTPAENEMGENKRPQQETSPAAYIFNTSSQVTAPVDVSVTRPARSPGPPPSLPLGNHFSERRPVPNGSSISSSSGPSAPPLNSAARDLPHSFNHVLSLNEDDTAVQPLLANQTKHSPVSPRVQSQRPFESKSDKDLSRYIVLGGKRQGPYDAGGFNMDNSEHNRLLSDLSKLSHSNTFPKPKINGISSDAASESDEDDTEEAPRDQQLDLFISEEDLCLSKENLVNSSFSSVSAPSRQTSQDRGLGLIRHPGATRPGIRKHQSEESPNNSKIVNKSYAFLQDNARTRSLDNPPGRAGVSPDPWRLNSTVAGSPDVETYDNLVPQPASQLHNHTYAYDPNDDSSPWDGEINRAGQGSSLTDEDRDRLKRLKDVLPDQQAIPI